MTKILILGGTGYTGRLLARHLLKHSEAAVTIATRHQDKAQALADELNEQYSGLRTTAVYADAADAASLRIAFRDQTLVVVAAPTTAYAETVIRTALETGVDYLDVQLGARKFALLQSLAGEITRAGRCFITEAGFHPGLPAALVRAWQRRNEDADRATWFLLLWAGLYLVFFSAAESKLPTYILPIFPPLALLVGRLWHELAAAPSPALRKAVLWSFAPFLLLPAAALLWVRTPPLVLTELAGQHGLALAEAASPLIALVVGLAAAFVLVLARRTRAGFAGVTLSFAAFVALTLVFIVPVMNVHQSSREMALKLDELLPDAEPMANYSSMRGSTLFYTDRLVREIKSRRELTDFLSADRPVYCVISAHRYREMGLQAPIVYAIGDDLLIANRRAVGQ